jgi:hypothetical protein
MSRPVLFLPPARFAFVSLVAVVATSPVAFAEPVLGPFDQQVAEHVAGLRSDLPSERAWAAEALGFLRVYSVEDALVERLGDESVEVRR